MPPFTHPFTGKGRERDDYCPAVRCGWKFKHRGNGIAVLKDHLRRNHPDQVEILEAMYLRRRKS